MEKAEVLDWLQEERASKLDELWTRADNTRRQYVGDQVHLRGLIEISNHCVRSCGYCGLRAGHKELKRYRMSEEEILESAKVAAACGYGTVVMQAGEDYGITREWLANIVRRIKAEIGLAVTLSLGERPDEDLITWKKAGADRYLLRFETSDDELYRLIHPPRSGVVAPASAPAGRDAGATPSGRIALLRTLTKIGYEAGSGVMVGIPGQTFESLANDILLFRELDLDMIGIGPYLSHPDTPLGTGEWTRKIPPQEQVPSNELMVYKAVALTRLACPEANIPSTTALATINKKSGRELGLMRGANIVMPNVTPQKYRALYEIYPAKACITEDALACQECIKRRIRSIGRVPGTGPGGRKRADGETGRRGDGEQQRRRDASQTAP
ncbi:MAG TPA: [FeFe] hydrogenase H-cluster radical SAM maturase HydE [Planctomycetota bacterium]|jgi:biotin synthase